MKKVVMKKAGIENVFIWMILFLGFASLFIFIINYATILRIQDNMNAISDYGANYVAINGRGDNISDQINSMKATSINNVSANTNAICNIDAARPNEYKVIFTTITSNTSYKFYGNKLSASRAVFNQSSSDTIVCTLEITLN
jgi:Flp pilus assembly protein TadG